VLSLIYAPSRRESQPTSPPGTSPISGARGTSVRSDLHPARRPPDPRGPGRHRGPPASGCTPRTAGIAYAGALDEVVLAPATAGDPAGERTLTALAGLV
jgi:hypothetical protein